MTLRPVLRVLAVLGLVLGFQPVLASLNPASAAPVNVSYTCTSTVFDIETVEGPQTIGIDFGLPSNVGDAATLTAPLNITDGLANLPFAVPDAQVVVQISLGLYLQGGALVTTPSAVGTASALQDLPANAELPLNWPADLMVSTAGFNSGDIIEVRPGTITLQYTSSDVDIDGTIVTCAPDVPTTVVKISNVYATSNACVAAPKCNVVQNLNAEVIGNANGLSLKQLDNASNFGSLQTAPVTQQLTAALDEVEVQDVRGGDVGWSLSAFASGPFVGGSNPALTIPASALALTSSCNAVTVDMDGDTIGLPPNSVCTPGGAGVLPGSGSGNAVSLASSADVPAGTGGTWRIPLGGTVTVPGYQGADNYSMVLTVVLSSN